MKIEFPALEQSRHLIPGLIHPTPADALNGDALENNVFREIQRNGLGSKTEQRNSSAAPDDIKSGSNGARVTCHFKHHVHAQSARLLHDHRACVFF